LYGFGYARARPPRGIIQQEASVKLGYHRQILNLSGGGLIWKVKNSEWKMKSEK